MKKRLQFIILYSIFWLIFFWICRLSFMIYNCKFSANLLLEDWFLIYYHGFSLDLSMLAYIMVIPCLALAGTTWLKNRFLYYFISIYTIILLLMFSFIVVADMELYKYWQFRLDASPLLYINTPKEMIASVSTMKIIYLFVIVLVLLIFSFYLYYKFVSTQLNNINRVKWYNAIFFLFITVSLIVPIRGGIGIIPLNVGSVYFHKNIFANHSAINVIWNVGNSLANYKKIEDVNFYSDNEVKKVVNELYEKQKDSGCIINIRKPNIIIIILESFTGDIIKEISGKEGITPNISKIIHEGIFFNNFYASGDRTDKALVAILSGYPALPTNAIINYPDKTHKLPFITKILKSKGYNSTFFYGGDIDFANIKSYLVNGEIDKIIFKKDFKSSKFDSKWGIQDEIMFSNFLKFTENSKYPFVNFIMTLSSHEPYDVPLKSKFDGTDEQSKFYNSAFYTDKCLGEFFEKAKQTKWWKNTLVIITADHGKALNEETPNYALKKYHIPMIWTGGAISKKDTVISTISSQTDILNTLVSQLNSDEGNCIFSKNILNSNSKSFAFYVFNNGFGFITDSTKQIYDNSSQKFIFEEGKINNKHTDKGKAYFQYLLKDFQKK